MRKTTGRFDGLITSLKINGAPLDEITGFKKHAALQSIDKGLDVAGTAKLDAS